MHCHLYYGSCHVGGNLYKLQGHQRHACCGWGLGKGHTWVRAVANKAHGGVGGVKHRQGSALDGQWQHASEPYTTEPEVLMDAWRTIQPQFLITLWHDHDHVQLKLLWYLTRSGAKCSLPGLLLSVRADRDERLPNCGGNEPVRLKLFISRTAIDWVKVSGQPPASIVGVVGQQLTPYLKLTYCCLVNDLDCDKLRQ